MLAPWGGGVLTIFFDGDAPFFRVSSSPIFSKDRVSKESNFSGAGCQNITKGGIL